MRLMLATIILALSVSACSKKEEKNNAQPPVAGKAPVAAQAPQPTAEVKQNAVPVVISKPVPVTPRKGTVVSKQQFVCKNGTEFAANFMRNPDQVEIIFTGRMPVTLIQEPMASGFSYATPQYKLLGKGRAARWIMTGKDPVDCVAK